MTTQSFLYNQADVLKVTTGPPEWLSTYRQVGAGKRTLVFCDSVSAAEHAAAQIGEGTVVVTGRMPLDMRRDIERQWRDGTMPVLCGVQAIIDWHPAEVVVVLRPTTSQHLHACMLTPVSSPGGILLDAAGNIHRHGLPDWFKGRVFTNPEGFHL